MFTRHVPIKVELRDMLSEKPRVFGETAGPGRGPPIASVQLAYVCNAVHALRDSLVKREAAQELRELLTDQVQACNCNEN